MQKKFRYILVFLILALVAAYAAWKYTFKESESNVSSRKTDITIEAPALVQAFETNEDSANSLYLEKIIQVSGTVGSVSEDSLGYAVYLKDNDALSGVMCSFDRASFDPSRVERGSQVIVKGLCTGYLLDVQLNKCSLARQ